MNIYYLFLNYILIIINIYYKIYKYKKKYILELIINCKYLEFY